MTTPSSTHDIPPAAVTTRLRDLPHARAAASLAEGHPVWVFVNPVEYHGPHLPLHTDAILSAAIGRALHTALWPTIPHLILDDLEVGVDPTPGPGTRPYSYQVVRSQLTHTLLRLREWGATKAIVMTWHGAPLHNLAIEAAMRRARATGLRCVAPFSLLLNDQLDVKPEEHRGAVAHLDPELQEQLLRLLPRDMHAGFFETSLMHWAAPQSVDLAAQRALPPCPTWPDDARMALLARLATALNRVELAKELRFVSGALGWTHLDPHPGYTSMPAHAGPEAGRFFAEALVQRFAPTVRAVIDEGAAPPPPFLPWVRAVTLGGRLNA